MIESGISQRLLSTPAVTAIMGTRLYPVIIPAGATPASYPCATMRTISSVPQYTNDGPTGFINARIQIETWSADYYTGKSLADAIRVALDGFYGVLPDGTAVLNILRDNGGTDYYEQDSEMHCVQVDYRVMYAQP